MNAIFTEALFLPVQNLPRRQVTGETRLLIAVLEEAVVTLSRCAHATTDKGRDLYARALYWFSSERHRDPFDFVSICQVMDWDAGKLRKAVIAFAKVNRVQQSICRAGPLPRRRMVGY